jgi:predicted permease
MPDWKDQIIARVGDLKLDSAREAELVEELSQHLEDRYDEMRLDGAGHDEAYRAALAELAESGSLALELRRVEGAVNTAPFVLGLGRRSVVKDLWQDVRYALRMFRKNPVFTAVAVLTLALGIGANTAIFRVVNAVLLRPLPYRDPERLVMIWEANPTGGNAGLSEPDLLDYRDQNEVFDCIAGFIAAGVTLTDVDNPERLRGGRVTADFFKVLRIEPLLGRTFLHEDEQPGGDRVVVLSHGLWQRRFGSDRNIVGQTISLNRKSYTVVGVLPKEFEFSVPGYFKSKELWIPAVLRPDLSQRGNQYLRAIGRLKPGVTFGQAQQNMAAISGRLAQEYSPGLGTRLVPFHEQIAGDSRPLLLLLLGSVGFVLLIACANVANLQLARGSSRRKEIAIRAALGASRSRVVRQLLCESIVLSLIGGMLGIALAFWGTGLLSTLLPSSLPAANVASNIESFDLTVLGYSFAVALLTGVLFGLAPAIQAAPAFISETLKEGGRTLAGGIREGRLRGLLVVSEVALSVILLIGAGLLLRSFVRLMSVAPGFETHNVLTLLIDLPHYSYPDATGQGAFYSRAVQQLSTLPGVENVGAIDDLPLTADRDSTPFTVEGQPSTPSDQLPTTEMRSVTPDYFKAMGIPLIQGRAFTEADTASAPPVLLVNQSLAQRFFPNQDPVGQRIWFGPSTSPQPPMTVVGVVGNVRDLALDTQASLEVYQPYGQATIPYMNFVIRTAQDPRALVAAANGRVHSLDSDLPFPEARPMDDVLAASVGVADRRSSLLLLGVFAALALVLSAVGIYGVISYSVARRTHEIGVRMALGAQTRNVLVMVLWQGLRYAAIGVGIGLAGAVLVTRVMSRFLFGVSATDPVTLAIVSLLLIVIALLACLVPARRATRVDPMVALRYE